jgi:predicted AAA+ superfamily ATPase
VATELVKQLSNSDIKAELYHFRTSDGKEVDFVLERPDGSVFAIEVKRAETVRMDDFKGIKAFEELTGDDFVGGIVFYSGRDVVPFGKKLWAVPFFALW